MTYPTGGDSDNDCTYLVCAINRVKANVSYSRPIYVSLRNSNIVNRIIYNNTLLKISAFPFKRIVKYFCPVIFSSNEIFEKY